MEIFLLYAIIDLGSNSVRMSAYRCHARQFQTLFTRKEQVGLAGHVEDGRLNRTGIALACYTLNEFKSTLENFSMDGVSVFATASVRNVSNSQEVAAAIARTTGYPLEILSGEEEAQLGFSGAIRSVDMDSGIYVDIGGGSTELAVFENRQILRAVSIPMGSLNTTVRYVKNMVPDRRERAAIEDMARQNLEKYFPRDAANAKSICGVGGTIRAAAKINNALTGRPLTNLRISADELKSAARRLTDSKKEGLDVILNVVPDRVRTMAAGMLLLKAVARHIGCDEIVVSSFGVREGYLIERVLTDKGLEGDAK